VGSSHARFHDYSPLGFVGSERATSSLLPSCCVIIGSSLLTDTHTTPIPQTTDLASNRLVRGRRANAFFCCTARCQ
jgi:hypothetical protein